jgi:hypothetical protein
MTAFFAALDAAGFKRDANVGRGKKGRQAEIETRRQGDKEIRRQGETECRRQEGAMNPK